MSVERSLENAGALVIDVATLLDPGSTPWAPTPDCLGVTVKPVRQIVPNTRSPRTLYSVSAVEGVIAALYDLAAREPLPEHAQIADELRRFWGFLPKPPCEAEAAYRAITNGYGISRTQEWKNLTKRVRRTPGTDCTQRFQFFEFLPDPTLPDDDERKKLIGHDRGVLTVMVEHSPGGNTRVRCSTNGYGGAPFPQSAFDAFSAGYSRYYGHYMTSDLTKVLRSCAVASAGVSLSDGEYFVPRQHMPFMGVVVEFLRACGLRVGVGFPTAATSSGDARHNARAAEEQARVTDAVEESFDKAVVDLETYLSDTADVLNEMSDAAAAGEDSSRRGPRMTTILNRMARITELREQAALYKDLLSLDMSEIEQRLADADVAMSALRDAADSL